MLSYLARGKLKSLLVALLFLGLLATASVAMANYKTNPPPQPGFTHLAFSPDDSPQHAGKLLAGAAVVRSSPVIANIDTNSSGNEVAVGGSDGLVYVYSDTGTELWRTDVYAGSSTPVCA